MGSAAKALIGPGMYLRGAVDYDAIDAVNFSTLKHMAKSPRHYQHAVEAGWEPTSAMRLGTAAHVTLLEPAKLANHYAVFEGTKNRNSNEWKEFEAKAKSEGRTAMYPKEIEPAFRIRDAVMSDPIAAKYVRGCDIEVTIVWVDEATGILCKGRVDALRRSDSCEVDVKTCADATPLWFARQLARLSYHMQRSYYADGIASIIKRQPEHRIIAVEQKEPHDVAVFQLNEAAMDAGRTMYRTLLERVKECRESGRWPGVAGGVEMPLELPSWAIAGENDEGIELMIDGESVAV